jgi:predicted MFS family arabinose efflux permease
MLLTLIFLMGIGTALAAPAWQATTPSLIPRALIPEASALGGMNQNLARIVGPAVAGVLIGTLGTAAVFAINALSLVAAAGVLLRWRSAPVDSAAAALERERLGAAMAAGTRYVRNAPMTRRLLLRLIIFVVPATVLWALLPLVASERLGLGSSGYGLLLACVGVGAILGAVFLSWLRRHLPSRVLLGGAGGAYAISLVVAALSENTLVVGIFLVPVGLAWLVNMVSIMGTVQQLLPGWVRARGLSIFQLVFMGGQAVAALGWGLLADGVGLTPTFLAGAALLALSSLSVLWWPLPDPSGMERKPTELPLPELEFAPDPRDGPVMITLQYAVRQENVDAFVGAMERVERVRRRTGAITWHLYRDGADLARFVEVYTVRTWAEHLQQHHRRVTGHDRLLIKQAMELAETPPVVAHLFPAKSSSLAES